MNDPVNSAVRRDIPQPAEPDETVWGSDAIADMLRAMNIPYVLLNPGASFRGLHDSLVNHLGTEKPQMMGVLHEEHAVAIAHGAGFLLIPIYLGLDTTAAHAMHHQPAGNSFFAALIVSAIHTLAMIAAGGGIAWLVYKYLGLQFLTKSWFNLELVWALSLIAAGAAGLWTALP